MVEALSTGLSRAAQDYLKAIYRLTSAGQPTGTVELAECLGVSPAAVTSMLSKLAAHQPKLVEYRKHLSVNLTQEGRQAALEIIRRHRLLEQFLFKILEYPWDMVHAEAEELEHSISPHFENRIAELLGEPLYDPHGEPIPSRLFELVERTDLVGLDDLGAGQTSIVRQVDSHRSELVGYLKQIGLQPGTKIRVLQRNPFDGSQRIKLDERVDEHVISVMIAQAIQVSLMDEIEPG